MKPKASLFLLIAILILLLSSLSYGDTYETPPVFQATDILPHELLSSEYHTVADEVEIYRYGYLFSMQTEAGTELVLGEDLLQKRVQEAAAIARLDGVTKTEAFITSLTEAAKSPLYSALGVVTRPVSTIKGLPEGATRYLQGKLFRVRQTIGTVKEKTEEITDDSYELNTEETLDEATVKARELARSQIGYNDAKRQWAKRLNVDPYSTNPALIRVLDRVAVASSLGSFAVDYYMPGNDVLGYINQAESLVWDASPDEIRSRNDKELRSLGISSDLIEAFHDHALYYLSDKITIVESMKTLMELRGLEDLLLVVLGAEDPYETALILKTLKMLTLYHEERSELDAIVIEGGMIAAVEPGGRLVFPLAIDYLFWTDLAEQIADELQDKYPLKLLMLSGQISDRASRELADRFWVVYSNSLEFLE